MADDFDEVDGNHRSFESSKFKRFFLHKNDQKISHSTNSRKNHFEYDEN